MSTSHRATDTHRQKTSSSPELHWENRRAGELVASGCFLAPKEGEADEAKSKPNKVTVDPDKPADEVLPGRLRPKFPGEHLDKSLNEIRKALKGAKGKDKRSLQTAKKLLEQVDRLLNKGR